MGKTFRTFLPLLKRSTIKPFKKLPKRPTMVPKHHQQNITSLTGQR